MRDIVDKSENEKTAESLIYNCGNVTCRRAYFSYFRGNVVPVFTTTCEAEVKALAINAANRATNSVLFNESVNYNDLFEVIKTTTAT